MIRIALAIAALALLFDSGISRANATDDIAVRGCSVLKSRVDAIAGDAPVFLRSYDAASGSGDPDSPALRTAAFTYDNGLAIIALLACDRRTEAMRIGEAIRLAAMSDTRLRNVYRAGAVDGKPLPNGWWDAKAGQWVEDPYQDGTATGNVAWAALAMLHLYEATHDAKWSSAAGKLAHWTLDNATSSHDRLGFNGGVNGFDAAPVRIIWKSTEHNIDLVALFDRLDRDRVDGDWKTAKTDALNFVTSQWDASSGHFFIGTKTDGVTPNRDSSALDAQLWAQLLPNAPNDWRRAIAYVEREHKVAGGFDFNADRDGVWIEGTAQAALVYRLFDRESDAQALFATIDAQFSTNGMVYATRQARITTGLSADPSGNAADFYYYRLPHLAATAWAVLAAKKYNPFARDVR